MPILKRHLSQRWFHFFMHEQCDYQQHDDVAGNKQEIKDLQTGNESGYWILKMNIMGEIGSCYIIFCGYFSSVLYNDNIKLTYCSYIRDEANNQVIQFLILNMLLEQMFYMLNILNNTFELNY